jgi:hypothetical protein
LTRAAKHFFIAHNNQRIEGEFDCLFRRTVLFGDRRHDVVHAVVRDESWGQWVIESGQPEKLTPSGYFILPTHYKRNRYDENMRPPYAYNSHYCKLSPEPPQRSWQSVFGRLAGHARRLPAA